MQAGGRRAAANIKFDKYKSDESDESDGSDELFENSGVEEEDAKPKAKAKPKKVLKEEETVDLSSDEDSPPKKKAAPKKQTAITDSFKPMAKVVDSDSDEASGYVANGKKNGNGVTNGNGAKDSSKDEFDVSDSGSDFEGGFAKKMANKAKKAPPKKLGTSDDLFDSMMADDDKPSKPAPVKKAVNKRPGLYSDDSNDSGSEFDSAPKAKKAPAPKKASAKKSFDSDDDDYGSDFDEPKKKKAAPKKAAAPKAAPKAEKKKAAPKKKKGSGSEDEAPKPKKAKAAPKKKKNFDSDDMSGSDFDISNMEPARDRPGDLHEFDLFIIFPNINLEFSGRGKKTVNYGGGDSGSGSDSDF